MHLIGFLISHAHWSPLHLLLPVVIWQRIAELRLARRHEAILRRKGAREVGSEHYPLIVALHVMWFIGMVAEIILLSRHVNALWPVLLAIFIAAQGLRYWTIRTLGYRWTTRVWILPNATPVRRGPYRYLRHPNYLAIVVELLVLPLMFNAWLTAVAASLINFLLLRRRMQLENQALYGNV